MRRANAHEHIASLKCGSGKDIVVFGSRTLWNDLLVAGLVDELHLSVGPVILRRGTPAFGTEPAAPLRLLGAHTWEDTDSVLIWYAPADRAS